MRPLNVAALESFATSFPTPGYDRTRVSTGIVHFGVGGFHRAHQAAYLDRLMNEGKALDWGITGVGLLPQDRAMSEVMAAQDCLYTLVVKHPDGTLQPRVVGSIVQYLFAPDDPEAVLELMADPAIRIVSLTITEGGYLVHPVTGELDSADPGIQKDLQAGSVPSTAFGFIAEALSRRRGRGIPAFTVVSCDNIPGNGDVAHKVISTFARLKDPELADWLEAEVCFPNSMVDRITPVTTDADRALLAEQFGVQDAWPVVCEPFIQWALEDKFSDGRPSFEDVGVQMVDEVEPYELMKLRLLNGSHQALAYLGYLAGYRYAHDVSQDPLFIRFLRGYMDHEATPTLAPVPGVDLEDYKGHLIERFANPQIRDTLARLCAETSDRIPKFLLPVIRDQLSTGGEIGLSVLVVASWARYAEGQDEQGQPIEVVDRLRDELMQMARRQHEEPLAFISNRDVFGDLIDNERFAFAYGSALDSLHSLGARATLEAATKNRV